MADARNGELAGQALVAQVVQSGQPNPSSALAIRINRHPVR
jgi:hypothetical protein